MVQHEVAQGVGALDGVGVGDMGGEESGVVGADKQGSRVVGPELAGTVKQKVSRGWR